MEVFLAFWIWNILPESMEMSLNCQYLLCITFDRKRSKAFNKITWAIKHFLGKFRSLTHSCQTKFEWNFFFFTKGLFSIHLWMLIFTRKRTIIDGKLGISCQDRLVQNVIQILINPKIYADSKKFLLKYGHRRNDRSELEQMQIAKSQPAISFACVLLPKSFVKFTLSFLTTMYSFSTKTLFQLFWFVCNKNARYTLTSTQSHAHGAKACRRNASRVIEMNKIK